MRCAARVRRRWTRSNAARTSCDMPSIVPTRSSRTPPLPAPTHLPRRVRVLFIYSTCALSLRVARRLNRAAQHELEKDAADKFSASTLDEQSRQLSNTSRGIALRPGVENVDNTCAASSRCRFSGHLHLTAQQRSHARAQQRSMPTPVPFASPPLSSDTPLPFRSGAPPSVYSS